MKTFGRIVMVIMVIVLLVGVAWTIEFIGIYKFGFMEQRRQEVRRDIYEESPSFVQGKILDLSRYKYEWDRTEDERERTALASVIRQQMVQLNPDDIRDVTLRNWYLETIR